jgi:flagellar biosynthesis protein FliR
MPDIRSLPELVAKLRIDIDPNAAVALVLLILARTVPLIVISPIFGGRTVPGQHKVGLAMILVVALYPCLYPTMVGKIPVQGAAYWGLILKELAVGAMLGFLSSLVFFAIESAGNLIDVQRGTQQASVLVPQLDIQGPVFANLHIQLATVLFFSLNCHHLYIRGYFQSFELIPVHQYPKFSEHFQTMINQIIHMSGGIFAVALQLTAPIVLAIFMVDVVMGVMNRIAPMVQVYFLAMPFKAVVGIIMFIASFGYILKYMSSLFGDMLRELRIFLTYLG